VLGARELTQRPLQLRLDGAAVRLLLPAGESAAVVLQHDFDIHLLTCSFLALCGNLAAPIPGFAGTSPASGEVALIN